MLTENDGRAMVLDECEVVGRREEKIVRCCFECVLCLELDFNLLVDCLEALSLVIFFVCMIVCD